MQFEASLFCLIGFLLNRDGGYGTFAFGLFNVNRIISGFNANAEVVGVGLRKFCPEV
jgi:hypothetical protein